MPVFPFPPPKGLKVNRDFLFSGFFMFDLFSLLNNVIFLSVWVKTKGLLFLLLLLKLLLLISSFSFTKVSSLIRLFSLILL